MTDPEQLCDLRGLGVLVTRPVHQADRLCAWIEASGGHPVRFPAIEITPAMDEATRRLLAGAGERDWLIFISANAVRHSLRYLPAARDRPVAAVGEATARALAEAGFTRVLTPRGTADSEGLLAMDGMQAVAGRNTLIVRGSGGRTLLGDTLAARGAHVAYAEVYRRALPVVETGELLGHWREQIDAVTATSGEILDNLFTLLEGDRRLRDTPLIVVSPRIAELATRRGFRRVLTARSASERDIVTTLCMLAETPTP